jgi:hypothetical protein
MWEAKGGVNAHDLARHIQFMRVKFSGQQSPAARGDPVPACGSATRPVPIYATGSPLAPHPGRHPLNQPFACTAEGLDV